MMSSTITKLRVFLAATAIAWAGLLPAHEFWIEPTNFHPRAGAAIGLNLSVGEPFRGEPVPRNPEHEVRFVLLGADGTRTPVDGLKGATPAGFLRVPTDGPFIAIYESLPSRNQLSRESFLRYLEEEGYPAIARQLSEDWPFGDREVTEDFSRCAKSLVSGTGGEASESDHDPWPAAGLPLEIVPVGNPTALQAGSVAVFQVLQNGEPLEDAPVFATAQADPRRRLELRTDSQGRISFTIDHPGVWLVTTITIQLDKPGTDADWRSHWSSLTFSASPPESESPAP